MHGFSQVYYLPNRIVDRDDDQLKLVVLGLDQAMPVSYTHLRAHETVLDLVCRLLLEKKKNTTKEQLTQTHLHK